MCVVGFVFVQVGLVIVLAAAVVAAAALAAAVAAAAALVGVVAVCVPLNVHVCVARCLLFDSLN